MARIDELFDKYSEEFIGNTIKGKIRAQDIQDISALLPLDIELIAIDNDGLLFQSKVGTKTPTLRITPEANIDTSSFEVVPQISGLFRLMSYDKEKETGSIKDLRKILQLDIVQIILFQDEQRVSIDFLMSYIRHSFSRAILDVTCWRKSIPTKQIPRLCMA